MFWIESSKNRDTIFECDNREVCEQICEMLNKHSKFRTYTCHPDRDFEGVPIWKMYAITVIKNLILQFIKRQRNIVATLVMIPQVIRGEV
jgi:hypothetical protein